MPCFFRFVSWMRANERTTIARPPRRVRAPGAAHLSAAGTGEPTTGPADGTAPAGRITIADRVVAAGRVADDVLASIVAGAELLVVPSRAEGFGIPVIEAMQVGTPVVHSDAPALVEVAADAGRCVPREDDARLAAAIAELWADRTAAAAHAEAGRAVAARHSWAAVAEAHWALYEQVAA